MPPALLSLIASIPSPASNTIGPLRAYGVMIGLGVVAGIFLARRRWRAVGGDPEDVYSICMWAVPAGLIGTRIYHVITDNQLYRGHWFDNPFAAGNQSPLAIGNGGLGIPGGIIAGVAVGLWVVKRLGIRPSAALDMAAPCVPLAQAIGRYGNWFNQELFGGPTDLPWAVQISPQHRPARYAEYATFHPTFLYESLWNLGVVALIIVLTKKQVLRPGRLFAVYIGGYFLGRLWIEAMRSDSANTILGLRVNIWISLICIVGALAVLVSTGVRRREADLYTPYLDGHLFDPNADTFSGGGAPDEDVSGDVGPNDVGPEEADDDARADAVVGSEVDRKVEPEPDT